MGRTWRIRNYLPIHDCEVVLENFMQLYNKQHKYHATVY